MHIDLNLLPVFIAIVETGSFTAAAERLHATQSTISQRIARLEEQLGHKLLERTTRSIELTEHGDTLLRYARRIELMAGEIESEFSDETLLSGEIRFSVPEDFVDAGFAEVFARFRRLQPRIRMELRIGLAAQQREWIESGEVDLAVIRSTDPAARQDALWSEPIHWIGSKSLVRDFGRSNRSAIPLVHVPAPCLYRELALAAFSEHAIRWNVVMTCPHLEGIRAAVSAGLGVAAMPECAIPRDAVILGERHGLPPLPDCNLLLRQREGVELTDAVHALSEVVKMYRWNSYSRVRGHA